MTDPAAMFEAAAARLREMAGAATDGPWTVVPGASNVWRFPDEGTPTVVAPGNGTQRNHVRHEDAAYIAAMSPPVALALADWLAKEARDAAEFQAWAESRGEDPTGHADDVALAVARAILGGDA